MVTAQGHVGLLIWRRGAILTLQSPDPPHVLAPPGGPVLAGETPEQAAARIAAGLGLTLDYLDYLHYLRPHWAATDQVWDVCETVATGEPSLGHWMRHAELVELLRASHERSGTDGPEVPLALLWQDILIGLGWLR